VLALLTEECQKSTLQQMTEQLVYEIRRPTIDELESIRQLRHEVLDPARVVASDMTLGERDFDASTIHFAAFVDGVAQSTVRIDSLGEGIFEVRKMATREAYRGRGLGSAVLRAAVQVARKNHARLIQLDARQEALVFYAKLGYVLTGETVTHEDGILNYRMQKEVNHGR